MVRRTEMRDKSMSGHTKESLDRKAESDARRGDYSPPWGWFPAPEPTGSDARDTYDKSYEHHSEKNSKK